MTTVSFKTNENRVGWIWDLCYITEILVKKIAILNFAGTVISPLEGVLKAI